MRPWRRVTDSHADEGVDERAMPMEDRWRSINEIDGDRLTKEGSLSEKD